MTHKHARSGGEGVEMGCRWYGYWLVVLALSVVFLLGGCNLETVGNRVKYSIEGEHYLRVKEPDAGVDEFRREVGAQPDSPMANYYYGRLLLRDGKARVALPYLRKASRLDRGNADYHFWTGLAYGQLKHRISERKQYEKALAIEPRHLLALTYLGHSYLRRKRYSKALAFYARVLKIWPESPSVLYCRALALAELKRTPEERVAWHLYLEVYPDGALARKATLHLNQLKDFSYRNYPLGSRTVTVEKIGFAPFSAELEKSSEPSIELIGRVAAKGSKGILQVVVYQKNDRELAKKRAFAIGKYLADLYPELSKKRMRLSWFGVPQRKRGKRWVINESVDFFITSR